MLQKDALGKTSACKHVHVENAAVSLTVLFKLVCVESS